jgi:hypothetical protein
MRILVLKKDLIFMIWPTIKKKIADFVYDEQGAISKRALIRLGIISATFSLIAEPSLACSSWGDVNFDISETHPECDWTDFVFNAKLGFREVDDGKEHCEIKFLDNYGADLPAGGNKCDHSYWEELGQNPLWEGQGFERIYPVDGCNLDGRGSEVFTAEVQFGERFQHSNSIDLSTGDAESLTATHEHSVELRPACDYLIQFEATTGGEVWGCCEGHVEVGLTYGVEFNDGTVIINNRGGGIRDTFREDCEPLDPRDNHDCNDCSRREIPEE